jgi:serine protease AprX
VAGCAPDQPKYCWVIWANDYHTASVNAVAAKALGLDGTCVDIAIIDSAVSPVFDLNSQNIVYNLDLVTGEENAPDLYGHGTHVAGIIAGNGDSSSGNPAFYTLRGIAPNAKLRVLDQNGQGHREPGHLRPSTPRFRSGTGTTFA